MCRFSSQPLLITTRRLNGRLLAEPARQPLLDGTWVKVTANHDGFDRVTYNDLLARTSGLSAATLATVVPATMRLLDEGVEQAVYVAGVANGVFDPGDYVLFYAQRNRGTNSDDNNVYRLTWGGANGPANGDTECSAGQRGFC